MSGAGVAVGADEDAGLWDGLEELAAEELALELDDPPLPHAAATRAPPERIRKPRRSSLSVILCAPLASLKSKVIL